MQLIFLTLIEVSLLVPKLSLGCPRMRLQLLSKGICCHLPLLLLCLLIPTKLVQLCKASFLSVDSQVEERRTGSGGHYTSSARSESAWP
jgi:hypothetical protein